jgi:hypothetical protein
MDKFLFTDGTNGVREVQSLDELQTLIESAVQADKIRIWLFSSNEWISYAAFRKQVPAINKKDKVVIAVAKTITVRKPGNRWLKKMLCITGAATGVFLVVNFTKIKWEKAEPLNISAERPDNVPAMDMDSLIWEIEDSRGQTIDKNTKNNLRLRNTWPDRIELKLHAERETSSATFRYFNVDISIDNSTGFNIDNAVVKLMVWKNSKVNTTDTLRFTNIRYDNLLTRQLDESYRGDSISVSFESIKAKAFNFCYSATTKNNSGNYNDRWFCRE